MHSVKKKKKSIITFAIFTYNEENRISYPIRAFLPYGEVIVFDNCSTDKTAEIATSLGAKVIIKKRDGYIENKKNTDFILKHIKTKWIYWGFADEIAPKTCLEVYKEISQRSNYKVVVQKRKTLLFDAKSEFVPAFTNIKLFRRDALDFSNSSMHQMGRFSQHVKPEEILYLPPIDEYSIYHFSRYNTDLIIRNFNIYSNIHSKEISKQSSGLKIITQPLLTFLSVFFLGGAFKYKKKGIIVSMWFAIYSFLVYAKAYEHKENITLESIESKFVPKKKEILQRSPKSNILQKLSAKLTMSIVSQLYSFYKLRNRTTT